MAWIISGIRPRAAAAVATLVAAVAVFAFPAPAGATAPWKAAEQVRSSLFEAQTALLLDAAGSSEAERAQKKLAAIRGRITAALRQGAFAAATAATKRGDVRLARNWLLVRDFRAATRFTRPGVDATVALDALATGEIDSAEAVTQVRKDLLDAYQARLADYLEEAASELERGFGPAAAESAALVRGYWLILAPEYEAQRGGAARRAADRDFAALERAAISGSDSRFAGAREAIESDLDGFVAAPFTPEEEARRAVQLTRFLDLVPIEYDDGTDDGQVTIPFELQEAVAFVDGAADALADLEGRLDRTDPAAVDELDSLFAEPAAMRSRRTRAARSPRSRTSRPRTPTRRRSSIGSFRRSGGSRTRRRTST